MGKNSANSGSLGRALVKSRFNRNLLKNTESEKWVTLLFFFLLICDLKI